MKRRTLLWCGIACLALVLPACGRQKAKRASREVVLPLLQEEAAYLKKGGEDLPPSLRVKATWTVEGIDLKEQPDDKDFPWTGAIRFRIRSDSRDVDGSVISDTFEKRFDYRYSAAIGKWIISVPPAKGR